MFERFFHLSEQGTTVRREVLAGVTTFLTMAYIIVLQPMVLSGRLSGQDTGMDFSAVMVATCLAAALATIIMGLLARYPIALAPGMGQNFFFVGMLGAIGAIVANRQWDTEPWHVGLGVIFIAGVLFVILSVLGVREAIMNAVSPSMKNAIAVGIGLFIAFIGLGNAGLIVTTATIATDPQGQPFVIPGTLVKLNTHFFSPDLIVFFVGLTVMAVLHTLRVRGSILWGIAAGTVLAVVMSIVVPLLPAAVSGHEVVTGSKLMTDFRVAHAIVTMPPSVAPTAFKMDLTHAILPVMIPYIIVFLFMDVFDTIGTLIGVTQEAGLIKNNKLPRAGRAMFADAAGTMAGAALGTSTVTSYIESAAGVEQGGRTGLTALVVAAGFLLALFFEPIVKMVGSYPAITAPALVIVGAMMIRNVVRIEWDDYSEGIPAFMTIIGIPLCYNIGDGLALGFIAYPVIKLLSGRGLRIGWIMYLLAAALLCYFIFVRAQIG